MMWMHISVSRIHDYYLRCNLVKSAISQGIPQKGGGVGVSNRGKNSRRETSSSGSGGHHGPDT